MDVTRSTTGRISDDDACKRDIPSFIEPRPPLILNPFMRPKPVMKTNLLELFEEEDSELEDFEFVQVYLRLKPCEVSSNLYEVQSDNKSLITSLDPAAAGHGRRPQHNVSKMYTFSHIFGPETSQKEIFEHVVKDNLRKLADGHSYTLLTYGASGSGKTYTLMGTVSSPGLVPRSLEYVFKVVDAAQQPHYKPSDTGADQLNYAEQDYEMQWVKKLRHISAPLRNKYRRMSAQLTNDLTTSHIDLSTRTRYYVWVSFVEIYNEAVYDLLVNCDRRSASKLRIREDPSGHVYVKGATQAFVRSGAEAYDALVAGKHNLQVAATGVHERSSRSHCIFTITLLAHTDEGVRISTVRLCDLAGAERMVRTNNVGARLKESLAINASLHVLERCLHALRRKKGQQGIVPYRESKLTRLLGAGLAGARGSAVSMVVTVNPAPQLHAETRHVLQLAAVTRDIQVNSTIAESTLEFSQDSAGGAAAARLRADNERLHFELAQSQAQYRQLLAKMEERQQKSAETMKEIADEAKDMTRQFYEAQIESIEMKHRYELDDLREEYESKLRAMDASAKRPGDTPSNEQKLIVQLTREIAILEEQLAEERLARARAQRENEHLRGCIEERDAEKLLDEIASTKAAEDVMVVDSDHSDDEMNESLEPSFRKDNLNTSRESTKSLDLSKSRISESDDEDTLLEPTPNNSIENTSLVPKVSINENLTDIKESIENSDSTIEPRESIDTNSILEHESVETNSYNTAKDSMYSKETSNDVSSFDASGFKRKQSNEKRLENEIFCSRATYVVSDVSVNESNLSKVNESKSLDDTRENVDMVNVSFEGKNIGQVSKTVLNKIKKCVEGDTDNKREGSRSDSLLLFEQCEMDIKKEFVEETQEPSYAFTLENIPEIRILGPDSSFELTEVCCEVKKSCSATKKYDFDEITKQDKSEANSYVFSPQLSNQNFDEVPKSTIKSVCEDLNIDQIKDIEIKNDKVISDIETPQEIMPEKAYRSPSIVKDETPDNYNPTTIKKLLGESKLNNNDSGNVFDDYNSVNDSSNVNDVQEKVKKLSLLDKEENFDTRIDTANKNIDTFKERKVTIANNDIKVTQPLEEATTKDNTIEDFENLYRNISNARATEFDLLVSETSVADQSKPVVPLVTETNTVADQSKPIVRDETKKSVRYNLRQTVEEEPSVKYNFRHKPDLDEEKNSKTEHKPKKSLRLRRRKGKDEIAEENLIADENKVEKLRNIENLQKEYSDVTLGVPVPVKPVKDIPSPEKYKDENCLPNMETMSCPSKSVTRSRRKLFTPRAEPLEDPEEHPGLPGPATGDSGEPLRVPRPSYHRPRARAPARRKL